MLDLDVVKKNVGMRAAELVTSGMSIGLGTGTTARYVIEALAQRKIEGLDFQALATSDASYTLAKSLGIDLLDPEQVSELDLCIDGADEIDPKGRMIKGHGGALWREKIVAKMSKQMIVIADETKLVSRLGQKAKLPVEVSTFGMHASIHRIHKLGLGGKFREKGNGLYLTDGGNAIFDLDAKEVVDPKNLHSRLLEIPGVIETGLFFDLPVRALIGYTNGKVEEL